MSSAMACSNAL